MNVYHVLLVLIVSEIVCDNGTPKVIINGQFFKGVRKGNNTFSFHCMWQME